MLRPRRADLREVRSFRARDAALLMVPAVAVVAARALPRAARAPDLAAAEVAGAVLPLRRGPCCQRIAVSRQR